MEEWNEFTTNSIRVCCFADASLTKDIHDAFFSSLNDSAGRPKKSITDAVSKHLQTREGNVQFVSRRLWKSGKQDAYYQQRGTSSDEREGLHWLGLRGEESQSSQEASPDKTQEADNKYVELK